jgi:Mn2+/Fe2+ NRAMP family transporter
MATPRSPSAGVLTGAAFLMAVSAIGPGFLTQTTQFTAQLGASLAFAILLSTLIDIGAQLNTWRIVCVSGRRGNELADAVVPGLGWLVTAVILVGSFIFNLGNLGGCALGLQALTGWPQWLGISLSALVAVVLFALPRMLTGMDRFSKLLGTAMILITFYVLFQTAPPVAEAARQAVWPTRVDFGATVTLVGGTVGGYIMFSGAHRLLDGGIRGPEQVGLITWASVQGILVTAVMRSVLFLAVLGVVMQGVTLGKEKPVFDAFEAGAGRLGYYLSGLVFWAAAITSVVGCSYTSVSFLPGARSDWWRPRLIIGFIAGSWAMSLLLNALGWEPTPLLIAAGKINGILLPIILGVILMAAYRRSLLGSYRHPWWAAALGVLAWVATLVLAALTVKELVDKGRAETVAKARGPW